MSRNKQTVQQYMDAFSRTDQAARIERVEGEDGMTAIEKPEERGHAMISRAERKAPK